MPPNDPTANPIGVIRQIQKKATAGQLMHELLRKKYATSYKTHARIVSQADLFHAFKVSGFDCPGQASHGHAEVGVGGGVDFGVDLGKAVLPGFLTAGASVGLRATGATETLVVLIRQPAELSSCTPVCFITARGKLWQGAFSVAASFGLKANVKASPTGTSNMTTSKDELKQSSKDAKERFGAVGGPALEQCAVEAAAELGVEASASYSGEYLSARDPSPNWYETAADPELEASFSAFIGLGSKLGSKDRIRQFFNSPEARAIKPVFNDLGFWQGIGKAITGGNIAFAQLQEGLDSAQSLLDGLETLEATGSQSGIASALNTLHASLAKELERNWLSRRFSKDEKRGVKTEAVKLFEQHKGLLYLMPDPGRSGYASLADWQTAVQRAMTALTVDRASRQKLLAEIEHHNKVITYFREGKDKDVPIVSPPQNAGATLTSLTLWGHEVRAGAGAKASIKATATPLISAAAEAGVKISTEKKWTSYRFQHFTRKRDVPPMHMPYRIFTQDTTITYAQTVFDTPWSVSASAAGVDVVEKIRGEKLRSGDDGKKMLFNSLSYEAASAVWLAHVSAPQATLLPGSGISYGQSLSTDGYGSIIGGGGQALLAALATQLHVQPDLLQLALERASALVGGEVSAVLVESSFAAGVGTELAVTRSGIEPQLDKDLMRHMAKAKNLAKLRNFARGPKAPMPLEAIRVRFRIADTLDQTATFKLGVPVGIFKIGIELNSVAKAGATGIVDLCTTWFGRHMKYNTSGSAPEDSVPTVTLMHQ